ncbi:MAG: spore germination protein, partial [Alicyclobacillaceae bacterium]|nr:spore germination protein [Alicyclobacillaceae bacterium]
MVRRGWERRNNDVPGNIDEIHVRLSEVWGNCDDIHFRWIRIGAQRAFVVWIYTLIGKELVQKGLLEPLTSWNKPEVFFSDLEQVLQTVSVKILKTMDEVNTAIGNGLAVLCIDGFDQAAAMDVTHFQRRAVKRPSLELSVQGPQEAFTESLETNLGLIRRRLKSPRVKVEYVVLGRVSKTRVALVYIDGIVKSRLVQECRVRLRRIDVDSILDSGHIEELIDDAPISLFPTIDNTERPDRLAAEILQGRVGIIVEGSPNVLLVPAIFAHFLQSSEDYFERYFMATAIRILRHFLFWIALLLPATYIALLSYHQ